VDPGAELLTVRDWLLAACLADFRSIALQTIEDAYNIIVIVFDELFAEAHHVGTACSTLPCVALALSQSRGDGRQCNRNGKTKLRSMKLSD
jgi:hypothetical protein